MPENYSTLIAQQEGVTFLQVGAVKSLLEEGATIPFIARYRKEKTGSLDEVVLAK
jgi:protein Tex